VPEAHEHRATLLLAVDLYPDGGGIAAILENCVQLLGRHYDVHVAIVDFRPERRRTLPIPADHLHILDSRHLLKPFLFPTSLTYPIRVGRFLRKLVENLEPKALLVQDGLFLPAPGLVATRGTGTKLVVMDHGTLTNSLDPQWQRMFTNQLPAAKRAVFRIGFALDRPWRELRWRLGFRAADRVWYVGHEMLPYIEKTNARSARYAQVVPVDFARPSDAERRAARDRLAVSQDALVVNMVTRLAGEKGLPAVLGVLADLAPRHPELEVLIAGDGPLDAWLARESARRGLPIRLLGPLGRTEIRDLHHASDFHLYAGTIGCGMSIALLEAMASGVVPVVSDIPAEQRELVADAGWVFAAGDANDLRAALDQALAVSSDRWRELSRRSVERVHAYQEPSLLDLVNGLLAA
jgi:glycosyltransferase involved in cell wall biosynthesis